MLHKPDRRQAGYEDGEVNAVPGSDITQSRIREQFDNDRLDDLLASLDQAMTDTDKVLEGIGRDREGWQGKQLGVD